MMRAPCLCSMAPCQVLILKERASWRLRTQLLRFQQLLPNLKKLPGTIVSNAAKPEAEAKPVVRCKSGGIAAALLLLLRLLRLRLLLLLLPLRNACHPQLQAQIEWTDTENPESLLRQSKFCWAWFAVSKRASHLCVANCGSTVI